ncbi:major facilitator superfamily domain-containing protein [Truncatella angustata]|uniref:Major facilitator superfamily domain-containing protein n=1 Tax=Truncatella angustata TaxID=152316 RepID=A0A9P9A1F7_9PEZI|nr:major facilitator superfamily domain-containing protein [Truncatella angustata]KAH6659476.1 major facilitator superfamily domain-containing protein [Truncatella angustata]
MTGIHVRRRNTREGGQGNVFVVGYEGDDDPLDPHNWSFATRIRCTFTVAGIGCVVGIASAIDSSAISETAAEFGVSEVAASLGTGLFLIGFGAGALFAGPISETVGRNPVYIATLVLYMIFIMASALAPNFGAWLAFRFIAGIFGSTPLTCAGGSVSDLWRPLERVWAFPIFANAAFTGPLLGPVMGGWIAQSSVLSWRWTEWITLIISGFVLGLVVLFQPETYPPILLKWKAAHLRSITGDDRYRAELEVRQESFGRRLKRALWRPILLTTREPIIILIALYLTVVYVVLFGFLDGFDYIFAGTYGTSQGITGICFLGIIAGLFGATALVPIIYKWAKHDLHKIKEAGGDRLPPEFRLWFSMLGGAFAIPISLFWMGWTARPDISIWSPLAASVLFGYGILCVFISCYQYIIDAYETYSASALASVTLIRYMASGGMVVASIPFYQNLGVAYTCTILGCISAALVPVPYVFYKYGPWIRSKSKYAISTTTK